MLYRLDNLVFVNVIFVFDSFFNREFSTGIHRRFGIMILILHIVMVGFCFLVCLDGEFRFALLVAILSLVLQWIFSC